MAALHPQDERKRNNTLKAMYAFIGHIEKTRGVGITGLGIEGLGEVCRFWAERNYSYTRPLKIKPIEPGEVIHPTAYEYFTVKHQFQFTRIWWDDKTQWDTAGEWIINELNAMYLCYADERDRLDSNFEKWKLQDEQARHEAQRAGDYIDSSVDPFESE